MDHILQSVVRALSAGRNTDAVHQFVQALSHDSTLARVDLPPLLAKSLGKTQADALIQAFAEHPCMVCRRGLLLCEHCGGVGLSGDNRICDACIGLGAMNCGFCAGSGWITYNYVPVGLRAAVVLARSKLAFKEAQTLLATPVPSPSEEGASLSRKELGQRLLRLNRLMGAFNNALGVARHPRENGPAAEAILKRVEVACLKAASKLERRIRMLLILLSENARLEAARATNPEKRELGARRAEFYRLLAKSRDFTGTSLFHLFLQELNHRSTA